MTDTDRIVRQTNAVTPWWTIVLAGLAVWFAAIVTLAANGVFRINVAGLPVMLAVAVFVPAVAWMAAYAALPALRHRVAALDMALVTGLQTFRVIGIVFLFLWALNRLPAAFAWPAGLGDVAVGFLALATVLAVVRKDLGWQDRVRVLTYAGILDFVVAFGTAILSNTGRFLQFQGAPLPDMMQELPMVLIPAFGVPMFLILHLIALQKLRSDR